MQGFSLEDVATKFASLEKLDEGVEDIELGLHLRCGALLHVRKGKLRQTSMNDFFWASYCAK